MRNYPNFIDEYIVYCKNHESTERIQKWSILSVLAAAMERRLWMDRGHYKLFGNMYVFIIGKSGLIKKSTSTGIAVNLFRELDGAKMMSERLTAASLIHQLSESGKRLKVDGKIVMQSALFAYASELSIFLEEVFGNLTPLLTTFYDCVPNDASKPWTHNTVGGGEIKIFGPCLNILGASTKAWLRNCIPRTEMEGGFTSRCVFVVENTVPEPIAWPSVSLENEVRRAKLVQDLKHIYSLHGQIRCTKPAMSLFAVWYRNHMKFAVPNNQDPGMSGYMARKGDLILKLAMIRSVACNDSLQVEVEDIDWGILEIDKLENNWRMAFDGLAVSPRLAFQVKEFVFKRIRCLRWQVVEVFRSDTVVSAIEAELINLVETEEIIIEPSKKDRMFDVFTIRGAPQNMEYDTETGQFIPVPLKD